MTDRVFVDAAAWIALLNKSDSLHGQAVQIMASFRKQKRRLVTTEFVLIEVADGLSTNRFRSDTIAYINGLRKLSVVEIISLDESLLEQGWQLYSQRLDQEWGLTDCTSFVVMQRENITIAFTSDRHFEQAGFVRLLQP